MLRSVKGDVNVMGTPLLDWFGLSVSRREGGDVTWRQKVGAVRRGMMKEVVI